MAGLPEIAVITVVRDEAVDVHEDGVDLGDLVKRP